MTYRCSFQLCTLLGDRHGIDDTVDRVSADKYVTYPHCSYEMSMSNEEKNSSNNANSNEQALRIIIYIENDMTRHSNIWTYKE